MKGDPQFTLYWLTGDREIVEGRSIDEAMTLAGYSQGALGALDFWAHGDDHGYEWNGTDQRWRTVKDRS
mgnify:CR=1 FL=1